MLVMRYHILLVSINTLGGVNSKKLANETSVFFIFDVL